MRITSRLHGAESGRNPARALGLVPVLVAVVVGALVMPRPVTPRELPAPAVDTRALDAQIVADHLLANQARARPLRANVRALGAALRAFNAAEVRDDPPIKVSQLRTDIGAALSFAIANGGVDELLELRAVQTEEFLAAVQTFESTGAPSVELDELGGTFVRTMMRVGWCRKRTGELATWPPSFVPMRVLLDDRQRRAAFKLTWNKLASVDTRPEFAPTLDESRELYGFYLQHPHAPEGQRFGLAAARLQAKSADVCARIEDGERVATFGWLLGKLKELERIDPSYPVAYARGIALYHSHQFGPSSEAFRSWLDAHPDGPYTLRARNYLAAAQLAANAL